MDTPQMLQRLIFGLLVLFGSVFASEAKIFVCYYTNWAQYRSGDGVKFLPENIDADLCTHIHYAFAKIQGGQLKSYEWNDESTDWQKGMYERVMDLKSQNPSLKVLLSVGGWTHGGRPFTAVVKDDTAQRRFVDQAFEFIKKHNFDGLDLDWEYPGAESRGSEPADKQRFTGLIRALRAKFGNELLLTAATGAGKLTAENGYEVAQISALLDYVALMTYDFHGSWENRVGFNAPLYKAGREAGDEVFLNVDWAISYWLRQGCPPEKLVMGLGTYGRTFTLSSPSQTAPGSPAARAGAAGRFTRAAGFLSYYEICLNVKNGWTTRFDQEQKADYAYKGDQWVGYDGPHSLKIKVDYLNSRNLGGAMVWALDTDDFSGIHCGQGKYPLMNAIKTALNGGGPAVTRETVSPTTTTTQRSATTTLRPRPTRPTPSVVGCTENGQMMADPSDCSKFLLCSYPGTIHEVVHTMTCPSGLHFDSTQKICDFPRNVNCNLSQVSPHRQQRRLQRRTSP